MGAGGVAEVLPPLPLTQDPLSPLLAVRTKEGSHSWLDQVTRARSRDLDHLTRRHLDQAVDSDTDPLKEVTAQPLTPLDV